MPLVASIPESHARYVRVQSLPSLCRGGLRRLLLWRERSPLCGSSSLLAATRRGPNRRARARRPSLRLFPLCFALRTYRLGAGLPECSSSPSRGPRLAVQALGLEPRRPSGQGLLRPPRLPISPDPLIDYRALRRARTDHAGRLELPVAAASGFAVRSLTPRVMRDWGARRPTSVGTEGPSPSHPDQGWSVARIAGVGLEPTCTRSKVWRLACWPFPQRCPRRADRHPRSRTRQRAVWRRVSVPHWDGPVARPNRTTDGGAPRSVASGGTPRGAP